jgi:hypothetical protein
VSYSVVNIETLEAGGPGGQLTMIAVGAPRGNYVARGPF